MPDGPILQFPRLTEETWGRICLGEYLEHGMWFIEGVESYLCIVTNAYGQRELAWGLGSGGGNPVAQMPDPGPTPYPMPLHSWNLIKDGTFQPANGFIKKNGRDYRIAAFTLGDERWALAEPV